MNYVQKHKKLKAIEKKSNISIKSNASYFYENKVNKEYYLL